MAKKKKLKKAIRKLIDFSGFLYDELQTTRNQLCKIEKDVEAMGQPPKTDFNYHITNKGF